MRAADLRPLVSVVITCCDQAPVLGAAVRSATARAARVQVVVVDDGSTDGTAAIARQYDVVFERQPRRGRAAAKNRGLLISTGEFVVFLDAGDWLLPGAIDLGVRALTSCPECAMAYGRALVAGPDGRLRPAPDDPMVRAGHHAALLQTNLIWMPAMAIFRREAVRRAGAFTEGLDGATDYDLYLRMSRDAPIVDHGCPVAAYGGGGAGGGTAHLLRDTLEAMRRNCPDPHTPLHSAWREGYARWQEIYGTAIADEIRADLHERALADAARKGLSLLSLAPRVFMRQLGRPVPFADAPDQRRTNSTARDSPESNLPSSVIPSSASRP